MITQVCTICKGRGKYKGKYCTECDGSGIIEVDEYDCTNVEQILEHVYMEVQDVDGRID